MRPLKLTFEAFNSYADKTSIDFKTFNTNGIFLITGPTGSGKTTIFDVIKFALYGDASGTDREKKTLFSDFVKEETKPFVTFEFLHRGITYRIERTVSRKQKAKEDKIEIDQSVQFYQLTNNAEKLLSNKLKDTSKKIEELLGIDSKQFSQIVMIAQGNFSKILTASVEDRGKLLRNIFNTEVYQQLQDNLGKRTSQLRKEHEKNLSIALNTLQNIKLINQDYIDKIDKFIANDNTILSHLNEVRSFIEEQNKILDAKSHNLYSESNQLTSKKDQLTQNLARMETNEKIKEKIDICSKYLNLHEPILKQKESAYHKAQSKEFEIKELDTKVLRLEDKIKRHTSISNRAHNLEHEIDKLNFEISNQKQQKVKLEEKQKEILQTQGELIDKRQSLEDNKSKLEEIERLISEIDKTIHKKEEAKKSSDDLQLAQKELKIASEKLQQSNYEFQSAEIKFNAAQAGLLASELNEGKPCPVCGSIHHPQLAPLPNDVPSEEEVKNLKNKIENKRQSYTQKLERATKSKTEKEFAESDFKQTLSFTLTRLQSINEFINVSSLDGIPFAHATLIKQKADIEHQNNEKADLNSKIDKINKELDEIEDKKNTVGTFIDEITKQLNIKTGELSSIKNSGDLINVDEVEKERQFAQSELNHLSNQLNKAKKEFDEEYSKFEKQKYSLQQLKEQLDNTLNYNLDELKIQIQEIENRQNDIKKIDTINRSININESPLNTIKRIYNPAIKTEKTYNLTNTLYELASGKRFTSKLGRISLESYVQRVYLQRVVDAANGRLAVMTDSQFTLKTKQNKSNKQTVALDFVVNDVYTGKDRDVKSLSGGEQFLTSLALALGFSDVIQQEVGGIELDSMFIDEGFGTLDQDTLEHALKILDQLSTSSNTLIGIISHVEELKKRIPQQIVVSKDIDGSSLKVITE